jgi:alpha-L-fucosidase
MIRKLLWTCILAWTCAQSYAQNTPAAARKELKYGAQYFGKRTDSAMTHWRSLRFGQFLHWGLYSIPGGEWNGKVYPYAAEFLKSSAHVSDAAWDSLMYQFNPVHFDPVAWAKMDKAMGVKYVTITTKHHEGFCLWPSKFTDFNISHTPYKKDILRQIVNAFNAEGIEVHFYYSILDWHNRDWRYDIKTPQDSIAFQRYLTFAYNQLKELATDYPTVNCFWFDGTWDNAVKQNGWWTLEVEKMLKAVHPGMIVNSRLRADDFGSRHFDSNGDLMGDYASGYERRLPSPYDTSVTKTDWEACMTIPENQWGYHKDWSLSYVKTTNELLEMLVRTTALGGNFLLNFGPKPDGTIRKEERAIADSIGQWMNLYGDAIYDCGYASGWQRQDWGYYTQPLKDSVALDLNAVVFNVPVSGILKVITPAKVRIGKVYFMAKSGRKEGHAAGVAIPFREVSKDQYNIYLPPATHFDQPFVIKIEVDSRAKGGNYQEAKT